MPKTRTPHDIISAKIQVKKHLILLTVFSSLIYLVWWLDFRNMGHPVLYAGLLIGEIYHVWQALGYAYTIWNQDKPKKPKALKKQYPVDIFITAYNEPIKIIEQTIKAAVNMDYDNHTVYLLNDGYNAKRKNWQKLNKIAKGHGAIPITRKVSTGAKAGNINNALKYAESPFFAVFDADHVPHKDFLKETMPYFGDKKMALVQTPQYYKNRGDSDMAHGAWEQQELFFGPIMKGKNKSNSTFWCGTNAVLRRKAVEDAGGIPQDNIAEDFLVSLFMHERGWNSVYVPKVLAEGLAPHDLPSYITQQYRWARGSLEVTFRYNPLFRKGLSFGQKLQYLYSSSYYLNGVIILIDALIPLLALALNVIPVEDYTGNFMIFFFPFIFSTIFLLMESTKHTITFGAVQLSISTFWVFIKAAVATLVGKEAKFEVTSKEKSEGNHIKFAIPHIVYTVAAVASIIIALATRGFTPSVVTNSSWAIFNIVFFWGFIKVAYPWKKLAASTKEYLSTSLKFTKSFAYAVGGTLLTLVLFFVSRRIK